MEIKLYSTHCPKCNILKSKLDNKKIQYEEINDVEAMTEKGFRESPKLEVDGVVMGYLEAINFVNKI